MKDVPEGPRKEAKITHATIYAPFHRKPRTVAADPEEQGSSEWFRCTMCTDVLPSAATLRHHLVKQHQQQDIKSFMCFLCKHECWSESQQEWHLRVHHGIKNKAVACSVCGTQLSTSAECKAHVRKHLATLACPSCSRKFSAQHQLVAHAKQHLEQLRPHSCLMCGARFTHCGVLQVHSWRHRPQKCPQEECEHIAEDESWLVVHLQNQHKLTGKQIHSIISPRDASDRRMDILLDKYSSLCENPLALLNSYKVDDYLTLENLSFSPNAVSGVQPRRNKNVVDLESSSVRQSEATDSEDCNIFKNVVNCLVEAVAGVEEEEKKAVRREEEVLQKVMEEGPTLYRCGLCNIYLPSAEELATHKAGHNQAIICLKCQKSFLSVKQLKRHMTVHSSQDTSQQGADKNKVMPEHRCLECGKTCGSESALSRHRGTHARSLGRHQCQTCKRRVRTRAHLIEHMARVHKINHESKKLQCSMCDRKFTTKTHLESHLVSHGEKEPLWSCDKCGRNYVRPRSLQRHMATHDFKFACSNCDETFMSARRLAIHARTHDPSHKTNSIDQCRAHHRMIHGNHKEACLECGKTFGDKTNLLRHRLMVHHHLKRWVCGVCAQSYAYSQDLRNHLQKQHNLAFERLDGTNKKSRHEVYVVPEMGSQDLNPIMEQAVESVCSLERRKVQQVLCGFSGTVRKTRKSGSENAEEVDNPDDPTSLQDSPLAIASLAVNDPPPTQETPLRATSILVPSATISIPTVIENSHIQPEHKGGQNVTATVEGEVQGFVRVSGVTCAECGVEATTPLQCGPCGALMCSQTHLDLHVASNHHVMFQCSVCGLHYGSQADCVAHVTAVHSSHLLAVQGGAATYLTPQSSQPIQINNGGNMQSQICMPLNNSQSTPQCLLQVGDRSPQVPLIIAPTTANVTTQQLETNNVILQYPNVNVLPAGFSAVPHSTALNPTKNQEKQAVFTMTGFLAGPQQTQPKHQRKVNHVLDKQEKQPSLCTITIPNSSDGGVLLPAGDSAAVNLSVGQNTAMLPAILPHQTSNGENSAFIMGNAGIGTTQNDSAPVLLMGSLPFNSVSTGSTTLLPQPKPCNLNNQANTSMASVLLTLAEPSHNDPMSSFMPSESSRVADEQVKQHSPSSVLVNNLPLQKTVEEQSNTEDSSNLLQSIVGLPVPDEEGIHGPTSSALHDTLVTEDQAEEEGMSQNPVHEVSVEIIQTQPRRSKAESRTKHYWEKEASQTPRDADNELPNNSGVDPSYQCSTCGKNFQTSAHLERHQRTHDSQKFRCQVYMRDLTEHKRTHEGSRPHVCKICEKCFVRRRDYTRHFREQHGTQRHQCKICGSSFKRRVYLETVHMRTHQPQMDQVPQEGNNPVQKATHSKETKEAKESHMCNICGRTFARARYLTSHLRTHSRRADYVRCPRCPRMFTSEQTLKVHKEAFHDRETTSTRGFNNSDFDDVDQKPVTEESFFPEVHNNNLNILKAPDPACYIRLVHPPQV
ncbi:Gastrula zinc finger protein xFG20-1-like [Homarus americanus]|uniref:Gastrula zinc finger protein xFG20-1-like n=1 Tax=Homarus americanus TaxID=6706 RepID=A0A8J5N256_HOMAM|nr:Gastrula zinc finger protein xFG20-1-like [Homarus americanus]